MARIYLVAKALCQAIRGEDIDGRIPKTFLNLEERWAQAEALWSLQLQMHVDVLKDGKDGQVQPSAKLA
jgi:hypothetical protein